MADPYTSQCYSQWSQTNYTDFIPREGTGNDIKPGWNYTMPLCQRICLLSTFSEDCQCIHPTFLDDESNKVNPPCDVSSDGEHYECVNNIYDELDVGARECQCNVECDETDYDLAVSQAAFPSLKYEVMILERREMKCLQQSRFHSRLQRLICTGLAPRMTS